MDKTQRVRLEFALNTLSSLKTMLSNWFGEPTSFPFVDVAVRLASANLNISFQFNNQTSGRLPSIEVGISFVYFKLGSPMSIQLSKRTGSSMFDIMSYAVEAAIKVGWEKWNQASSGDDSSE